MTYSRICRLLLTETGIAYISVGTFFSRGKKTPHFFRNLLFNGREGEREAKRQKKQKVNEKGKQKETSSCNDLMFWKIQ